MNEKMTDENATPNELIRAAQNGDQNAFEQLLALYKPLLVSMVHSFRSNPMIPQSEYDDLDQETTLAFYRAALSFDTTQEEVSFGLYAKICIRNSLISQSKKILENADILPLYEKGGVRESDPGRSLIEKESFRVLYDRVRRTLSDYEYRVWNAFLSGRTASEIANDLNTDKKSVQNAIFRIRKKLREVIPKP